MCILTYAVNAHPLLPFVVIHNRDESVTRPTSDLTIRNEIVAAFDELMGGTWMGIHRSNGNFCALTNFRTRNDIEYVFGKTEECFTVPRFESRGKLVTDMIASTNMESTLLQAPTVGPFNIVFGNLAEFCSKSNSEKSLLYATNYYENYCSTRGISGVGSLSNGNLDDMSWPKVNFAKKSLEQYIKSLITLPKDPTSLANNLGNLFLSRSNASTRTSIDDEWIIPQDLTFSPYGTEIEAWLQSDVFLRTRDDFQSFPKFGTVSQSVLLLYSEIRTVYYYYRTTSGENLQPWQMIRVPLTES